MQDNADLDVARAVHLLHRRRGWAWTSLVSLIALVVYTAIGVHAFANATGAEETISVAFLLLLLGSTVLGLILTLADTVLLRRRHHQDVRARAAARTAHYPVHQHAYRYPPRHKASWVFTLVILGIMTLVAVVLLPAEVNAVAYLTDAGSHATFEPISYHQACGRGGCSTVTDGILDTPGMPELTWPGKVTLGQPFTVRVPVWSWGVGHNLIDGAGSAIAVIIIGLIFDGATVILILALVMVTRHTRRLTSAAQMQSRA